MTIGRLLENLLLDLRYAARGLRAHPMLVVAATTSVAIGVGVNLAIFGLANNLLMSAPTARDPGALVHIRTGEGRHTSTMTWRALEASGVLAGLAGHDLETDVIWRGRDDSATIMLLVVTANFFDVVGVPVALGRGFTAVEADHRLEPRLAVVSDGFWKRRLGGDPAIIGQPIVINGEPYTVLGVLPAGIRSLPGYGIVPDAYLPQSRSLQGDLERPRAGHLQLIGRLQPNQRASEAHAALATVAAGLGHAYGDPEMGMIRSVAGVAGIEQMRDFKEIAFFVAVLLVITILVLTVACANVAGLLLARTTARRKEIALRLAIGASRGRLVQLLLTEGLLLSILGGAGGFALAFALGTLVTRVQFALPLTIEFQFALNGRVMSFAAALIAISTLVCGLTPALQSTRPSLAPVLKEEVTTYGHRRFTARGILVVAQVTVSVLLLVITVLFLRNLGMSHLLSPEFDADRTLTAQVTFVEGRQGTGEQPAVIEIARRLRSLPGIEAVSFAEGVPLTFRFGGTTGTDVRIEGGDQPIRVDFSTNAVGPEYFEALGLKILRGRGFRLSDRVGTPLVVVINQEFSRRYFDGRDPVGRHITIPVPGGDRSFQVVGVVSDSKYRTIGEDRQAAMYQASLQSPPDRLVNLIVRTSGSPDAQLPVVRNAVSADEPAAAVTVEPMRQALRFALLPSQIGAALVGSLGAIGALLAMIGLYGVMAFAVSRRTSEFGIRMALGASRRRVARLVLADSAVLVGVGLVTGLVVSLVVTGVLRAFLVAELNPRDPFTLAATTALVVLTSLFASWGPMRRAVRVDPAVTLRVE